MKILRWGATLLMVSSLTMAGTAQSPTPPATSSLLPANYLQKLNEVAHIASVMIDGDVCQHIVTPRAMSYLLDKNKDPRDKWAAGDNYDVNAENFDQVKKMTMRLASLAPFPLDVNLWMPVATTPQEIQVVVRNRFDLSQFWHFGAMGQKMPPEMAEVLKTGRSVTVRDKKPGMISVLSPVRNSLGQIVGLVEVASSTTVPEYDDR